MIGIEEVKLEIAVKMLKMGSDLKFISDITGLPIDKITGLKNNF